METTTGINQLTCNNTTDSSTDFVMANRSSNFSYSPYTILFCACYSLIFFVGIIGNGLVIYVVIRFTKMITVTNIYILNLAVADLCFVIGLPFLIVTSLLEMWVFGYHMCKVFLILTSINWFTSVFTLVVMSVDRYLAVCHPITSMPYRTTLISRIICLAVWCLSLLSMVPIILYATTETNNGSVSCTIDWPKGQVISSDTAFIWYAMLLGFAIPVAFIVICYSLVVNKLRSVGPKVKSKEKQRTHRRVTKMVLTVIAVYIVCWLPYWVYQITLIYLEDFGSSPSVILTFMFITVLSYANSMLNPFIYAFLSENFRKSFVKAFRCAAIEEVNGALQVEASVFPGGRKAYTTNATCEPLTNTKTVGTTTSNDATECVTTLTNIDIVMKQEEKAVHQHLLGPTSL